MKAPILLALLGLLFGSIDRVSGELQAYSLFLNPFPKPNTYEIAPAVYYSLKCK